MNKKDIETALDKYFANVSREEFIADLKDAGFTVYKNEETLVRHVQSSYTISSEVMKNLAIDLSMLKETSMISENFEYRYMPKIIYQLQAEFLMSGNIDFLMDKDAA